MANKDYIQSVFNSGAPLEYATERKTLSELVGPSDVIKIDTDGYDLQVLHGATKLIKSYRPLVLLVEVNMQGKSEYGESSFSGIHDYLINDDFSLLDIQVYRYERGALPRQFQYGITAQSVEGPVCAGDVTYVDDPLIRKGKLSEWLDNGIDRCFKLLALYDILGFPDCTVELLNALSRHPSSAGLDDWQSMIDIVDPDNRKRIELFKKDPTRFFPGNENV